MNDEKEKWKDQVFQSMKGNQRAKPRPELLAQIEDEIARSKTRVVPLPNLRYVAAAAACLLLVNTGALIYYHQQTQATSENVTGAGDYEQSLISSYQIYE